jgi:hypothetical protein
MAPITEQLDLECCTESHTGRLCYMVSQGFHLSDEAEYRALVENPRYQCNHCGRIAARPESLCVPYDL